VRVVALKKSGLDDMISTACVPIDPVDPKMAIFLCCKYSGLIN
jgi:hypothetical protein